MTSDDADLTDLLALTFGADGVPPEREEQLLARLDADPAFRQAAARELHTLGQLRAVQSGEPRWLRLADAVGETKPAKTDDEPAAGVLRAAAWRKGRRAGWVAAGLAACVALVIGWQFFGTTGRRGPRDLAVVTHAEQVEWADGESPLEIGDGVGRGPVRLRSGWLVLKYPSGVLVGLTGETAIELLDAGAVRLDAGQVRVRAPDGAAGFTVRGAGYEAVDLGTEFGLTTAPGGNTLLRVFEGRVAVSVHGPDRKPVQSRMVEIDESVEIDPVGKVIRKATIPADTFAPLPVRPTTENSPLVLSPTYRAEVLAAGPWGYWRFESAPDRAVPNEIPGRPALVLEGKATLSDAGPNRSAVFARGEIDQSARLAGTWTPPRADGYAVEFWVQATPGRPAFSGRTTLLALFDPRPGQEEGHVALVELLIPGPDATAPCGVRLLDRWPPGRAGGVDVFTARTFAVGPWHHVVGRRTADRAEVYLDGESIGSTPTAPADDGGTTGCSLLVGRLKPTPMTANDLRPFDGQIDELAVYDRPLPVETIRRHAAGRR